MIDLLEKPLCEWTELEAIVETIKLWTFLAKDGKNLKNDYFERHGYGPEPVLSGCFLCEYYFTVKRSAWEKETGLHITRVDVCDKFNCCLKDRTLCRFNETDSAFNIWYETDIYENPELRQAAAEKILSAVLNKYKELTGEDYYEK